MEPLGGACVRRADHLEVHGYAYKIKEAIQNSTMEAVNKTFVESLSPQASGRWVGHIS